MLRSDKKIAIDEGRQNIYFSNYFDNMYPAIYSFAIKILNDSFVAEDLTQEVFVKLWHKFEDFNSEIGIRAFLYQVIRNDCLNHIKHIKVKNKFQENNQQEKSSESFFLRNVVEEETHRLVHLAIQQLPERARQIIELSMRGYKNEEIAEELNISLNTVKTQKARSYKKLKDSLKPVLYLLMILVEKL